MGEKFLTDYYNRYFPFNHTRTIDLEKALVGAKSEVEKTRDLLERGIKDGLELAGEENQLEELEKRGGKAILVVGFKQPRWPECRFPDWYEGLGKLEKETGV